MKTLIHSRRSISSAARRHLVGAFDPALPEDGALIIAEVLRDQFNALNDDIQNRATSADLNNAVSALEARIEERVTETELNDAVNGLNAAIDQRVTQAQLNAAMSTAVDNAVSTVMPQTSANSNQVGVLSEQAYAFYDQYQFQEVIDKIDELINALRR